MAAARAVAVRRRAAAAPASLGRSGPTGLRRAPLAARRSTTACSSSTDGEADAEAASFSELQEQLAAAAAAGDLPSAVALCDRFAAAAAALLERERALHARLAAAVAAEDYAVAAQLRDALYALPPPPESLLDPAEALLSFRTATAEGVHIEGIAKYGESASRPLDGSFAFECRVTVVNESHGGPVTLDAHVWRVVDARGGEHGAGDFWGESSGASGPVVNPGEKFVCFTWVTLPTPYGSMGGELTFLDGCEAGGRAFLVSMAPFGLRAPKEFR